MAISTLTHVTYPRARPQRLRRTAGLRGLVTETRLHVEQLVHPIFVHEGVTTESPPPIVALPGQSYLPVRSAHWHVAQLAQNGLSAVMVFGIPSHRDADGTGAYSPAGPVARAIASIKQQQPALTVIADVCLCHYTSHGHCGVLAPDGGGAGSVDNDASLRALARTAITYADAGADIVAPSAMMDGQVAAIRAALDRRGHTNTAILSYSTKFASAFYGPFRDAAGSQPKHGNRLAYQLNPANAREAVRESLIDEAEGADALMVKPAGSALDIIARLRDRTNLPIAAYQVSGEYAMLKAAAQLGGGILDEKRAVLETLTGMRRAGADILITYYAADVARWLNESNSHVASP